MSAGPLWEWTVAQELPSSSTVRWCWGGRFPAATVVMLGGAGGVGKTILVAGIEVAVAAGVSFLGRETERGRVLHLDFDTDAGLAGPWFARVARGMGVPQRALSEITYGAPAGTGPAFLTVDRLAALADEVTTDPPALVVVDAWVSAFPWVRSNATEEVAKVMAMLRDIARLGPAVLVLDHLPKPIANGPPILERGLLGSVVKSAGARAVHLLQRVAPREVAGRDVQRLDCLKNNLAPIEEAVGIERVFTCDALTFSLCDLPADEATHSPALARALRAVRDALDHGGTVPRRDLLRDVVRAANVSERTAATALGRLTDAGEVERVELDGRSVAIRAVGADSLQSAQIGGRANSSGPEPVQGPLHESGGLHDSVVGGDEVVEL